MRRHFIFDGDKTTAGGVVLEGCPGHTFNGRKTAYHGAKISCPACKSTGVLSCVGPRRPYRLPNQQQVALENDLCLCRCAPPPTLIASQTFSRMDFTANELAQMAHGLAGGQSSASAAPATTGAVALFVPESGQHSERVVVINPLTGESSTQSYTFIKQAVVVSKGSTGEDGFTARHFQENESARIHALLGQTAAWTTEYHSGQSPAPVQHDDMGCDE